MLLLMGCGGRLGGDVEGHEVLGVWGLRYYYHDCAMEMEKE